MTLDDDLVKAVDRVSKQLKTNRSSFTRMALREALDRLDNFYKIGLTFLFCRYIFSQSFIQQGQYDQQIAGKKNSIHGQGLSSGFPDRSTAVRQNNPGSGVVSALCVCEF
jgi:hypothetical protein